MYLDDVFLVYWEVVIVILFLLTLLLQLLPLLQAAFHLLTTFWIHPRLLPLVKPTFPDNNTLHFYGAWQFWKHLYIRYLIQSSQRCCKPSRAHMISTWQAHFINFQCRKVLFRSWSLTRWSGSWRGWESSSVSHCPSVTEPGWESVWPQPWHLSL